MSLETRMTNPRPDLGRVTLSVLFIGGLIAGSLWSVLGPSFTFLAGAGFAAVAAFGLLASLWYRKV